MGNSNNPYDNKGEYFYGNRFQIGSKNEEETVLKDLAATSSAFYKGVLYVKCDIMDNLIQRFGEAIAEDAEDFMTPKDVVRLAVGMLFANEDELMNSDTGIVRTIYDPTMGTGGFITDALDMLDEWHSNKKMVAPAIIVPHGQECEQESWAMGKANLLLRNVSDNGKDVYDATKDMSAHIMYGDTLSDDKFFGKTFNFILSNPPYGKKWEKQEAAVKQEAKLGFKGRFGAGLPCCLFQTLHYSEMDDIMQLVVKSVRR